jgi:hypothetical protein
LENKRAEQVLPGNKVGGEEERETGKGGWQKWGEVAQTMYTHMNKCKNNLKRVFWILYV